MNLLSSISKRISYQALNLNRMMAGNLERGESKTPFVAQIEWRNDRLFPQLFTSVPSLDDAASYLQQTTTYFTSFFSDSSAEYSARESRDVDSGAHEGARETLAAGRHNSSTTYHLIGTQTSEMASDAPTRTHPVPPVASAATLSQNTGATVGSPQIGQSSIAIFQSLVERARRTVRGSADDIGWLQRAPGNPPVEDGTERFMEFLDEIKHGVHRLPKSVVYLLIPGLFSNHGPLYFVNTKTSFSKMGLTCHIAKIHSEASVEKNAKEIKEYVEEIFWGSGKRVVLLGHSKGGVDAAAALSMYWSDLKDKVAGLALAQSPYGGSPIASDFLREGQLGDYVNLRKLTETLICKVMKGDMQALEDLTYEKRREFLNKYRLPRELPVVSMHTEASISPAVPATLSRIAHAELPGVAPLSTGESAKLPIVVPLGATMAACAWLLQLRYGEKSDGLVTCRDAEVPGSIVVFPKRKLDHTWMVYSSLNDDSSEGDASQVCEALLALLVEVGQKKRQEMASQVCCCTP